MNTLLQFVKKQICSEEQGNLGKGGVSNHFPFDLKIYLLSITMCRWKNKK